MLKHRTTLGTILFSVALILIPSVAAATDWLHWRGPTQSGYSPEKNLPDEWDPRVVGKDNLIWKQPYGCRSTPLIMSGRVYIIGADNEPLGVPTAKEKPLIGERVTCFDAVKGTKIWEKTFNVFHSDIVANRLGWAPMAGDPANKRVYAHSTGGFLMCFNSETGEVIWQRSLTEEFGRVTGYGGRIGGGPTFDSGLVIMGLVNSAWGNHAIGMNRFYAFDGANGNVVWTTDVPGQLRGTYYSNPIIAVINGERLAISGGADGALHAFQVRTGKSVWSYPCAVGVMNPSPVVDGNLVYMAHGEENPEGAKAGVGRVVCVDASQVVNGKPKLVWEFRAGVRFGLASLALGDGKLYVPDDGAKLYCFDAKKGPKKDPGGDPNKDKPMWKYNYGTVSRGAPLIADGKIYLSETNYKFHIIKLKEDGSEPDENDTHTITFKNKPGASGFVESNCTPSIADGRIYLATRDELYCIGNKDWKPTKLPEVAVPKEDPGDPAKGMMLLYPAEVTVSPGDTVTLTAKWYTSTGMPYDKFPPFEGSPAPFTWTLPQPPLPKGATVPPPPLNATTDKTEGPVVKVMIDPKMPAQHGYVEATIGMSKARARIRVAPKLPYKQDFEKLPVGATPGGWINVSGKYRVVEEKQADGTMAKILMKVNTDARPPLARALGYITTPWVTDYTIEADLKAVPVRGKLPDLGVCANRYIFILDGKTDEKEQRQVRITTWEALPTPLPPGRVGAEKNFTWKAETWYRVKLSVVQGENDATIRAKIWERDQKEPADWTMEVNDPRPNREGAPALYGYISNATDGASGAEAYYDNVVISPNPKK